MRETQHIIFYGPLGMRIFAAGAVFPSQAPAREINSEVLRWRLCQRDTNPLSYADASRLESMFSEGGIINETDYNYNRFGPHSGFPGR